MALLDDGLPPSDKSGVCWVAERDTTMTGVTAGHYICDKSCLQWTSSQICSHTLVAAETNGEVQLLLQWYTSSDLQPNITQLAMAGLPKGRGRKGGIPKRKPSETT